VDLVVPPAVSLSVIQDCIEAGIKRIWFQPGSESEEAIQKAKDAGMEVVHDACIMIQKREWGVEV
jgi:predicted CoA-binding protein